LIGLLIMQAPAAQKSAAPAPSPYVERIEKQFSFYPGGKLEISTAVPGNIRVVGWERASVMMTCWIAALVVSLGRTVTPTGIAPSGCKL
jgi:hypothetical protein